MTKKHIVLVFASVFILYYAIMPLFYLTEIDSDLSLLLSSITILGVSVTSLTVLSDFSSLKYRRIQLNLNQFSMVVLVIFCFFAIFVFATSEKVPIIASFQGASAEELSQLREVTFKSRTGLLRSLTYINDLFLLLIPYLIILLLENRKRIVWVMICIFSIYLVLNLQKGLFLRLFLPLSTYFLAKNKFSFLKLFKLVVLFSTLISFMYFVSGSASYEKNRDDPFFSTLYIPDDMISAFFWRAIVIPIYTAFDTLRVFTNDLGSNFLYGKTSLFVSSLTGTSQINLERLVYQYQFGGSETGNANSFYLIEAYVNFGYIGVIFFSLLVGFLISNLYKNNIASFSLIYLFLSFLHSSGIIGTLLGGGWLVMIFLINVISFKSIKKL